MEVLEAVGDDGGRISGIGEISRPSKKNFLSFFRIFSRSILICDQINGARNAEAISGMFG